MHSEEKHEPVSGVDIAVAVSLKVLDLDGRLEKRTSTRARGLSANDRDCVETRESAMIPSLLQRGKA